MCSICLMNPCHPRCPNAEPEKLICEVCGCEITGKFHDGRRIVCKDCLEEMGFDELMKELNVDLEDAV